ncbi:MAG: BtrH N-terminal domain-containing protein [Chloroflexales bacterium]|nr:BtrH N-terminal domain-containing protein [Chloroflexales bacterium]
MTRHKHLKQLVRARMQKTGESYATARRHIIRRTEQADEDPATCWHVPGNIPATTALRVLFAHTGTQAPHTGEPFSEAMLFGIAGGIGIGVFAFYYEREDVATFFVGGRHQWHDDNAYLCDALDRLGITPIIQATSGAKTAEQQLRAALDRYGPCIVWVDMAELPHRAMPESWSGGGYHVVTVYKIDDSDATALIGDLADEPIRVSLTDLARARARIKKQQHRLLSIPSALKSPDLRQLVYAGLQRCSAGLLHPTLPNSQSNARLEAIQTWAERMHGARSKERWERVFRPGPNFWRGLCSIYDFIEHYGTGGGLCRPLFADFLSESAEALGDPALATLAEQYAELGRSWSELADAALPNDVPALRGAKELHARKAELLHSGAPSEEIRAVWQRLGELEAQIRERFPLSDQECADLRVQLRTRIIALYEGEIAAHAAMQTLLA